MAKLALDLRWLRFMTYVRILGMRHCINFPHFSLISAGASSAIHLIRSSVALSHRISHPPVFLSTGKNKSCLVFA
jgi:hypothetical protein